MKVWIVFLEQQDHSSRVLGVFDTKEKADSALKGGVALKWKEDSFRWTDTGEFDVE